MKIGNGSCCRYFIQNAFVVNEGKIERMNLLINNGKIEKIWQNSELSIEKEVISEYIHINATGKYLLPGMIDEHVHFRQPGLTHKGDMYSESRAALAGGVTSVLDMPNVQPPTITHELLEEKYELAKQNMFCNYGFYLAATDNNLQEILHIDKQIVPGLKLFLGSSTGNMLISDDNVLDRIFQITDIPILVHAEDEQIIKKNTELYRIRYGENMSIDYHCEIRSEEACFVATQKAIERAKRWNTHLHILHVSTAKELTLLSKDFPNITVEVCPSYLFFDNQDYKKYGTQIKCNPSIKTEKDKISLKKALAEGTITTIGSDHAPHIWTEKQQNYFQAPSGMPMVQHSLQILLEMVHQKELSIEKLVEVMAHQPAKLFNIHKRGFIKEGFFADLVLVDLNVTEKVESNNIYYKCNWSPLLGFEFHSHICQTFVNGVLAYNEGVFTEKTAAMALKFDR